MRVLWWSVASPLAPTGYGRVTAAMARALAARGHEVHVLSVVGHPWGRLDLGGIPLYPTPAQGTFTTEFAERLHAELSADVVVFHGDFWPYARALADAATRLPLVLYSPVDHRPLVAPEREVVGAARLLATFTRWSVAVVRAAGLRNVAYVPHGVDPKLYRPGERRAARRALRWPEDAFIALHVGVNRGDRKYGFGLLRAWALLLSRRPELRGHAYLALHTYPHRDALNPEGYDLWNLAADLGVLTSCIWTDRLAALEGVAEEQLCLMYQAADVHVLASKAEGFGLPIVEAGACGVPTIATNYAAAPELLGAEGAEEEADRLPWELPSPREAPGGWLVDVAELEVQQLLGWAWQAVPSARHLSEVLEGCVDRPEEVAAKGQAMRQRVLAHYLWGEAARRLEAALQAASGVLTDALGAVS